MKCATLLYLAFFFLLCIPNLGNSKTTAMTPYMYKRQAPEEPETETELTIDDPNDPCWKFTTGFREQMEFYSPMYPENYPKSIDCLKTIIAPEGKLIRVDFRDQFQLENEEHCKYDYLEVRDGLYGYSHQLKKVCGSSFPEEITSSDRYLWLRFVSDVSIEYSGFRAVYTFIDKPGDKDTPMMPPCVYKRSGPEGWVNKTDISNETLALHQLHTTKLDCMFVISVKEGWFLQLQFPVYKMDKPNECEFNFIEVFPNVTHKRVDKFCGSIAKTTTVKSNVSVIRFVAEPKAFNSTFAILWTAYREIEKTQQCADDEFDCADLTCIPLELTCNKNTNCRYAGDEDAESTCIEVEGMLEKLFTETHMIAIVALFFIILAGMCSTFIYNCCKKLIRDHRIIKDQMAESRASRLDQIGKPISMTQLSTVLPAAHSHSHTRSHSQSEDSSGASVLQRAECCAPDAELLPILRSSGHTEDLLLMPEMRDSECQTRESLFHTASFTPNSSAGESFTPPPPPPPPTSRPPRSTPRSTASPGFSTFGKTRQKASVEPRFRAEAVIELSKRADSSKTSERPFSVQSTKSAPDVIVTH